MGKGSVTIMKETIDQYSRPQVPQLSATVALSTGRSGLGDGWSIGCNVACGVRVGIVGSTGMGGKTNGIVCAAGCGGGETTAGGRIGASVCLLLARLGPFFFEIGLHAGLISAGSVGAAG